MSTYCIFLTNRVHARASFCRFVPPFICSGRMWGRLNRGSTAGITSPHGHEVSRSAIAARSNLGDRLQHILRARQDVAERSLCIQHGIDPWYTAQERNVLLAPLIGVAECLRQHEHLYKPAGDLAWCYKICSAPTYVRRARAQVLLSYEPDR